MRLPCACPADYGSKGNQELLFTYGFAVRDNPLDAVEGIVVGCRPSADAALMAERRRLLDHHEVPYTTRESDGALLIGPFDLRPPTTDAAGHDAADAEDAAGEDSTGDDLSSSWFPEELWYALQVVGTETAEEGPGLSLCELELLQGTLEARLGALHSTALGVGASAGAREGFVAAYREGQRRVLEAAIAELETMTNEMQMEGGDQDNEMESASSASLAPL